jgi:hypothetical protein
VRELCSPISAANSLPDCFEPAFMASSWATELRSLRAGAARAHATTEVLARFDRYLDTKCDSGPVLVALVGGSARVRAMRAQADRPERTAELTSGRVGPGAWR